MDDELRRLFADDRLDLPARDDADATIVAGARRRRIQRMTVAAAGGAAAVAVLVGGAVALAGATGSQSLPPASSPPSVTPTSEAASPPVGEPVSPPPASPGLATGSRKNVTPTTTTPKPQKATIGPNGYASLRLGMTAAQAEATGLLVPNAQPVSSTGCTGYDYKGAPNEPNHYSVLVSETFGVVRIAGRSDAVTGEGLGVGASESALKRVYPDQAGSHGAVGEWVTAVPNNASARYWIILRNEAVSEIRIELAVQDCYA